jgi:hypothetical protein
VGGGFHNSATGAASTVGGGESNVAAGNRATVGGGDDNHVYGKAGTIAGGWENLITDNAAYATIAGGGPSEPNLPDTTNNRIFDNYSTIGGGGENRAGSDDADPATAIYATVGGGLQNTAAGNHAVVAGGTGNSAEAYDSAIGGGINNTASGQRATVGGGYVNAASGGYSVVAGGSDNTASGLYSTVGGGQQNTATAGDTTVAGGVGNHATASYAAIGGGAHNEASGSFSTVVGGYRNAAGGDYSFAGGRRATVRDPNDVGGDDTDGDQGTFVWADSTDEDFTSTGPDQFLIRAAGGVGIGTDAPSSLLTVDGMIESTADGYKFPDGTVQTTAATGGSLWAQAGDDIYNSNAGNVGIGTTTPEATLHVDSMGATQLRLSGPQGDQWADFYKGGAGLAISLNGDEKMRIANTGNVGIGTGDPNSPLHVVDELPGSSDRPAIYGEHAVTDYYGVGVVGVGGWEGVEGRVSPTGSASYTGVAGVVAGGDGTNYGVFGSATGSFWNCGVYGIATGGTTNYAGYLAGDLHCTNTLSKGGGSFKIDHPLNPENKYLYHSFVESPDMMNVYTGNVVTDSEGYAVVELPDWFEVLNRDFRYQLTVIGEFAQAIVAEEIRDNAFVIQTDAAHVKVSWQVTGVRQDPFANANRVEVEVDKPEHERGTYLHPEAWGQPEERGLHYEQLRQMRSQRDDGRTLRVELEG